jgi:glycosyltransferase involved in cell wall biosynthesis
MRILTAFDVFSGCSWYRGIVPGHAAQLAGHEVRVAAGEASREDIAWCDVLQVQRLWHPTAKRMVSDARMMGKMTVYDVDDDLWDIHPENPSHDFWHDHHTDAEAVMRLCARVTTTGRELAATLRRHHDDVRIVANAIPDDFRRSRALSTGGPLIVGWAGGNSHAKDLALIEPIIREVVERRDVVVWLSGCGDDIIHDRVLHPGTIAIEHYHAMLSMFDIGLAPLVDSRFNRAKSDLKPLEYAGVGVPCVASRIGPYRDLTRGVLTAPSLKEFRTHLYRLIDDAELRSTTAAAGLAWADTRRISAVLPQWLEVWSR